MCLLKLYFMYKFDVFKTIKYNDIVFYITKEVKIMPIKLDSKQQEEIFQNLKSLGISVETLEVSGGISLQPSSSSRTTLAIGEEHPWWS